MPTPSDDLANAYRRRDAAFARRVQQMRRPSLWTRIRAAVRRWFGRG